MPDPITRIGNDVFTSWFGRARIEEVGGGSVRILAPSKFIADYISGHFLDEIAWAWAPRQVVVAVRSQASDARR